MSELWTRLNDSVFTADLGPRERSLWRFLVALFAGLGVFLLVSIVVLVVTVVALIAIAHWPAPTSAEGVQALMRRILALMTSDAVGFGQTLQVLAIALPSNIVPVFAFIGVALLFNGQGFKSFLTAAPRFRWRLIGVGLVLSFVLIGPFVALGAVLDPKSPVPPVLAVSPDNVERATYALICAAAFLLAAAGEEILFRGWLLRQMSNLTHNLAFLMLANGAVFAAAHMQFELDAFLDRWILGAGLTYMTLRLGGVELSTGVHTANNLMIVLFLEPLTLKAPPDTGLDASSIVPFAGLFLAYVLIAEITVRWTPLRRWSGAGQTLGPPAIAAAEHFA